MRRAGLLNRLEPPALNPVRMKGREEETVLLVSRDEELLAVDLYSRISVMYRFRMRFFFFRDDMVAYNTAGGHWVVPNIVHEAVYGTSWRYSRVYISPEDRRKMADFFPFLREEDADLDAVKLLTVIDSAIMEARRKRRNAKEKERIDKVMSGISGRLPAGTAAFVREQFRRHEYVFVYGKTGSCTACGKTFPICSEKGLRSEEKCPCCGRPVTIRKQNASLDRLSRESVVWFETAQPYRDGNVLVRTYMSRRVFSRDGEGRISFEQLRPREMFRTIVGQGRLERYQWSFFRGETSGTERWSPYRALSGFHNDGRIPFEHPAGDVASYIEPWMLKGTWAEFLRIPEWLRKVRETQGGGCNWPFEFAAAWALISPLFFEQCMKLGLGSLVMPDHGWGVPSTVGSVPVFKKLSYAPRYETLFASGETELRRALRLPRDLFRVFAGLIRNGAEKARELLWFFQRAVSDGRVRTLCLEHGREATYLAGQVGASDRRYDELMHVVRRTGAALPVLGEYLSGQRVCLMDYADYVREVTELGRVLGQRTLFPDDFAEAHRETSRLCVEYRQRIDEAREADYAAAVAAEKPFGFEPAVLRMGFIIRHPKDVEEIRREGRELHHCVGTYVEKVLDGETDIWFVRSVSDPDKPYYTMEYRQGQIVQVRGQYNCAPTEEVRKCTDLFKSIMGQRPHKEVV